MGSTVGILVHRDNHFIVRGLRPEPETALALLRHWSLINIGGATPRELLPWTISTREFRENLEWAIVVDGHGEISSAVAGLLRELAERGIAIQEISSDRQPSLSTTPHPDRY